MVTPRTLVSQSAQLSPSPGCVVLACAVVNANALLRSGLLVNSGVVVDHDAICGAYSQLGINVSVVGGSRLGPLAALAAGEAFSYGESRCAELQLAPAAVDRTEGLSCHGSAP